MALMGCPECKRDVSDQAAACPHCGFPLRAHTPNPPFDSALPPIRQELNQGPRPKAVSATVVVACVLLGGVVTAVVIARDKRTQSAQQPMAVSGPAKPTSGYPNLAAAIRPKVPQDPLPSSADKAGEVPALEARLANDSAYLSIWKPALSADRLSFLSAVSEIRATMNGDSATISEMRSKKLQKHRLLQPVITLSMIFARAGRYPDDFENRVRGMLAASPSLPHLGICGAVNESKDTFDISALSAWVMKGSPVYLRALLGCRKEAAFSWPTVASPMLPYIQTERGALERIALLDDLTHSERERLSDLKLPTVEAVELWRAYDANEVAADNQWKGNRLIVSGAVAGISRDFTDAIVVQIRSPNEFAPVQAYVKDSDAPKAAALKKLQKIVLTCTCAGKVVGVPVLRDCVIRS